MNILGLSCHYHDAAAALLRDGQLVAAAEEERFSRKKHDAGFPDRAIEFCLRHGGLNGRDLDYVVFYEKPFLKFHRLMMTLLAEAPRTARVFRDAVPAWVGEKLWIKPLIQERLGVPAARVLFCGHHVAHAASAFFCSPFQEAALLTVDGVGEWSTATLGRGTSGEVHRIDTLSEIRFPHSLGLLYSAFTAFLGFEVNEGEYKVMGMAAYGRPRHRDKVERLLRLFPDGSFELDLSYFSFPSHRTRTYSSKFTALFGEPRDPRRRFCAPGALAADDAAPPSAEELERGRYYADVAASVQAVTEDIVLRMARHLHQRTGSRNLCFAGGVALNSVVNHRLATETPFERIYVQPAAGDAGGALGAALYAAHVGLGQPRRFVMEHPAWGEPLDEGDALARVRADGRPHVVFANDEALIDRVAGLLAAGQVVGWAQGRFEWGPRALGQRSILADPRRAAMRDVLNGKIKFRESFRPFAPAAVEEYAARYFDFPAEAGRHLARFMLMVAPVREAAKSQLPAVTHVDGTARLQTVSREHSPLYHRLLTAFGAAADVPVLMNTSFNLRGEPIVASARDALRTFSASDMDALVLGRTLVFKERP